MVVTTAEPRNVASRIEAAPRNAWEREAEDLLRVCGVDQIIEDATVSRATPPARS